MLIGTFLAAAFALVEAPLAVRLLPGLAATLVLPGYAMSVALFPDRDFNTAERLAISFGLSLALIVVVSILISWTPWGFRSAPLTLGLAGTTVGLCVIAEWRRQRTPARPSGLVLPQERPTLRPSLNSVPFPLVTLVFLLALAGSGVALAVFPPARVTEFYALGADGLAENYPHRVVAGRPSALAVGIVNGEGRPTRFRVSVMLDGQTVGAAGPITLDDRGVWRGNLDFAVPVVGSGQELEAVLFKGDSVEPYRLLRLWVDAVPAP